MVWRTISNIIDFGRTILILFMALIMLIAGSTLHDIGITGDLLTPLEPVFDYIKNIPQTIEDIKDWLFTPKTDLPNDVDALPLIIVFLLTVLANIFGFRSGGKVDKINNEEDPLGLDD